MLSHSKLQNEFNCNWPVKNDWAVPLYGVWNVSARARDDVLWVRVCICICAWVWKLYLGCVPVFTLYYVSLCVCVCVYSYLSDVKSVCESGRVNALSFLCAMFEWRVCEKRIWFSYLSKCTYELSYFPLLLYSILNATQQCLNNMFIKFL